MKQSGVSQNKSRSLAFSLYTTTHIYRNPFPYWYFNKYFLNKFNQYFCRAEIYFPVDAVFFFCMGHDTVIFRGCISSLLCIRFKTVFGAICLPVVVCLPVSGIVQNPPNRFQLNLVGGCSMRQRKTRYVLERI